MLRLLVAINHLIPSSSLSSVTHMAIVVIWLETSVVKAVGLMVSHPSLTIYLLCKLLGLIWKRGTTVPTSWIIKIKWHNTWKALGVQEGLHFRGWCGLYWQHVPVLMRSPFVSSQCYQTGLMSQYVESWKAGDTAFWRGPFGGFFYKPNQVSARTESSGDPSQLSFQECGSHVSGHRISLCHSSWAQT